jgi:hypothetical protein
MKSNQAAPTKLAALFSRHMAILEVDADVYANSILEKDPALEEVQEVLQSCRNQAHDVRMMCANIVRTGAYTCATIYLFWFYRGNDSGLKQSRPQFWMHCR